MERFLERFDQVREGADRLVSMAERILGPTREQPGPHPVHAEPAPGPADETPGPASGPAEPAPDPAPEEPERTESP